MEVLPIHQQMRYQIATAAVTSILFHNQGSVDDCETAIDLSIKTPANTTLVDTSLSLPETSFSKARSFHRNEISSPREENDSSSSDGINNILCYNLFPKAKLYYIILKMMLLQAKLKIYCQIYTNILNCTAKWEKALLLLCTWHR